MASAGLAASATWCSAADAKEYWVYFGCYTGGKGGSKGITRSKFNASTGTLSQPELAAEVGSPSFLAISTNNHFLYAVGEGGAKGKRGGGVYAYIIDGKTGSLTKINDGDSVGSGPCHVSVDPSGKLLFVANYGGGSSTAFAIDAHGGIGKQLGFHQYKGSSIDKNRQSAPHSHCTAFTADGSHCFVVDLGLDAVMVHPVNPAHGQVSASPHVIAMPKGSGPRHIALSKSETIAYVNGELDMTVNVVKLDLKKHEFKVVQSLSTVPEGKPMPGYSTAEVKIHPNGHFVYVSNRGQNSIAAFAVQSDGTLQSIGYITGDIKTPRNFNIDPTGAWMLIANQDGHNVQVYKLDEKGLGQPTEAIAKVGSPVCVKFVPVQ